MLGLPSETFAQCEAGQSVVVVEILTDNYPGEITWTLSDANGQLLSGGPYGSTGTMYTDTVCIEGADETPCLQFVINDSYGDGICCGYGQGAYNCTLMESPWPRAATTASKTLCSLTVRQAPPATTR